jgi:uncharacterized membrane protein
MSKEVVKEVVKKEDVLAAAGGATVQPPFVQRAGLWLAAGVGVVITIVTIGVVVFLYLHHPDAPCLECMKQSQLDTKAAIEQYREMSEIAVTSARELFQTVVTQALLPVFTAILGYIFAKGSSNDSQ